MQEVFKDEVCTVVVGDAPITLGHVKVVPVQPVKYLEELKPEAIAHMYQVASVCAMVLFDGLKAHGTNVIVHNGFGQPALQVIARTEEDNLGMIWEPVQGNYNEISDNAKAIKGKVIDVEVPPPKPVEVDKAEKIQPKATDMRLGEFRRIP